MIKTLKAIKEVLLTEGIYEGEIFFLQDRNAVRLCDVYFASSEIIKENKKTGKDILFKTGESPFYVRELLTGKKIPVIYLEPQKSYERYSYSRNPKFNTPRSKLPEYCIIFDKWLNRLDKSYDLGLFNLDYVNEILYNYKKLDKQLEEKNGAHIVDEIIKSCLNYTRKATEERERLEKKKNDDEAIKKVLIERYLKNEK